MTLAQLKTAEYLRTRKSVKLKRTDAKSKRVGVNVVTTGDKRLAWSNDTGTKVDNFEPMVL